MIYIYIYIYIYVHLCICLYTHTHKLCLSCEDHAERAGGSAFEALEALEALSSTTFTLLQKGYAERGSKKRLLLNDLKVTKK